MAKSKVLIPRKRMRLQWRKFVDEYFEDFNQTQAAIRAGYSPRSAKTIASDLMKEPEVQEMIDLRLEREAGRLEITPQRILDRLACYAFSDISNVVDIEDGEITIKDKDQISVYDRAAIQEISITKGRYGASTRVKLHDSKGAAELLGKYFGLFKDKVEMTGSEGGPMVFRWLKPDE